MVGIPDSRVRTCGESVTASSIPGDTLGDALAFGIRRATPKDLPVIAALERELVRTDAPGDPYLVRSWTQQEVEERFHPIIAAGWAVCLVAECGGRVVGYLSGGIKDPPWWRPVKATEIHSIYVEEQFRSRGFGTQLIDAFVRWSRDHDAQVVEVGAFASNVRAIEFYEKTGFQPSLIHLELPL